MDFDTDYDRENPITRHKAIAEWKAFLEKQNLGGHNIVEQHEFGYGGDARFNQRHM